MADHTFAICCILLVIFVILYLVVSEGAFRYSDGKYELVRRETRLMHALLEDWMKVSKSADIVTRTASPFSDSDQIQDGTTAQVLNESEIGWIKKARESLLSEASPCLVSFEKLRRRRNVNWLLSMFEMATRIDVARKMKRFDDETINDNLGVDQSGEKVCASEINRSLEQSRSKIRSLLDRSSVHEIESAKFRPPVGLIKADELTSSLETLRTRHPDLMRCLEEQVKSIMMHLQLLDAFMEDVHRLKVLESEMENTWVKEANDTILQAKDVIDTINATENDRRRLSKSNNWICRRKHRENIISVGTWISGLLKTKERFGIKFIRFESSKSAHHSPQAFQHPTEHDTDLSNAIKIIRNLLDQLPKTSTKLVSQVTTVNEELDKLSEHTKATEDYAVNLRNACWKLLKETASEADEQYQKEDSGSSSKLLSKIILVRIKNAVNLLERCLKAYSIEARKESCSVVGFDEDIHELVSRLTTISGHANSLISIVGMKGIGKTTLAKKVYHHDNIAERFPVRRWVSLPPYQDSDELAFLRSVGIQVLETKEKYSNAYESKAYWIDRVRSFFNMKFYLLVLDNVMSMEVWDSVKRALPERANGSKIVLITRNKAIASTNQNSIHQLRLRTDEESWELFSQIVQYGGSEKNEISRVKEVVGSSFGGLPLDIIRAGNLLWGKQVTGEEIFRVLGRSTRVQNQNPWSLNLAVNREDLQQYQSFRECLSYFQLFPPDFEVPVRRIVASWVAKGIDQNSCIPENWVTQLLIGVDQNRIPETLANKYLLELIGRDIIQEVKKKPDGKVKTCRLPNAMRALLLQGQGINRSETRSRSSGGFNSPDHGPMGTNSQNVIHSESMFKSILFFETVERNKPNQEICEFLRKGIADGFLRQLQFLDLERVFQPQLPKAIGKLKRLVYLGLRWTYLESIPKSVGKLVDLQTLDLKHTYIHQNLPSSIWKLKKLRYLYLNHNCQLTRLTLLPRSSTIGMTDLQKLSGVFVDNVNLIKDGLENLIKLQKLELAFQLETSAEQDVLENWIAKLKILESLKLKSIDKKRELQDLKLQFIPTLKKLSRLHLFGKIVDQRIIKHLPQSLTHLTLSGSGIIDDPMPTLGTLNNLISLSFYSGSYQGRSMECLMNGFPKLLVLKLCNLGNLKILVVKRAMEKLRNLEIKSSNKSKMAIIGLTRLTTVQVFEQSAAAEE